MNGSPVSASVQIVDQAIVQVTSGAITVSVRALTETREVKKVDEKSVLNFISREYARVGGDGFKPQTTVRVWLLSTPRLLGEVVSDANGRFDASLLFTADIPIGTHTIQITGVTRENALTAVAIGVQVSERILQKIDSVTATVVDSNLNLQWSGNSVFTKITFQPSRGKSIIYLVEESGREFSVPGVKPGYAYQIRLEALFDPATDSAKSISVVLPPLAPRDVKFSPLSSNALQVKWVGDEGSVQYRVSVFVTGNEVSMQVTAEPFALININPTINQTIKVVAIGDGGSSTDAVEVLEFLAPKPTAKPGKTSSDKKPTKQPIKQPEVIKSLRAYLPLTGKLVPTEIRLKLAALARGMEKGSSVRCTVFVPSEMFSQGTVSRALRKTVALCEAVRKFAKESKVYASVSRTSSLKNYPRSARYLFEVFPSAMPSRTPR